MWISIWFPSFFAWSTQADVIDEYKKMLNDSIFACIEMLKQGYIDVMLMPVKKFYDILKWKADIEEQKMKMIEEGKK
jgi:hypothetical protein